MKRLIVLSAVFALLAFGGYAWATPAGTCKAGGGIPVTVNATNSAGGTAILCANAYRVTLFCENTGTTNGVWLTWGQDPTATNSFYLGPNGGYWQPPSGCASKSQSGSVGTGCVPTSQINALGAASGTNTTVCWED